jgi:hypothetical protein
MFLKDKSDHERTLLLQQLGQYVNRELNLISEKVNTQYIERIYDNSGNP